MDQVIWYGGIAVGLLFLLPIGKGGFSKDHRTFYQNLKEETKIPLMPPAILFGPIWFVFYVLIAIAVVDWANAHSLSSLDHLNDFDSDDSNSSLTFGLSSEAVEDLHKRQLFWYSTWALILFNWLTNKLWTLLFFDYRSIGLAVADVVGILLSAIAVLVLFCTSPVEFRVLAVVCWSIYTFWVVYATILTAWIAGKVSSAEFRLIQPVYTKERTYEMLEAAKI